MRERRPSSPLSEQDRERFRDAAKLNDTAFLGVLFAESPMGIPINPSDREFLVAMARTRLTARTRQDLVSCADRYLERDSEVVQRNREALTLIGEKLPLPPTDPEYVEKHRATPGEYGQRELNS